MATRRMFSLDVCDTDKFLDLPASAQALYFHLGLRADDDGFVRSPKRLMRLANATEDDFRLLIMKELVIPFASGVCVIRDWRIHNYIAKDRYHSTLYKEEMRSLGLTENKSYYLMDTGCIQPVYELMTEDKLSKDNLSKIKKERESSDAAEPLARHLYGSYENVLLSGEELEKLKAEFPEDWELRIERLSEYIASSGKKYKSHLATLRRWARKERETAAASAPTVYTYTPCEGSF